MSNLVQTLGTYTEKTPDAPALISGLAAKRRVLTFADVGRMSAAWAHTLTQNGVKAGDHVLILQPISIELYLALLAVFRIGAVAVFPDPQSLKATIEAACERTKPAAMIGGWPAQLLRIASRPLRRIGKTFSVAAVPWALRFPREAGPQAGIANVSPDHPALITFTSGSTGAPKVIARSHGFLAAQHAAILRAVDFVAGTATMTALPVFVLSHLACGVTSILPATDVRRPKDVDPAPMLAQIAENKAHTILGSPALVERLAHASDAAAQLATVRDVFTGGGPIFPDIVAAATRAMPAARVHLAYGSTEAEPIAHIEHKRIAAADFETTRAGGGLIAGLPTPGTSLAILRDKWGTPLPKLTQLQFDALRVPQGEIGEIVVAGDHVVRSYLGGVGNAESKIDVDGRIWHRTGDAGWLDARRRLWLVGRCAYRLKDTPPLYPLQVEAAARMVLGSRPLAAAKVEGQAVLVVEGAGPSTGFGVDRIVSVAKIPLDRRHQSKIDYASLKALLNR